MIIYKVTNIVNNKIYIGKTIHSLNTRMLGHINKSKKKLFSGSLFYKALRKYGETNFKWEIIDTCDNEIDLNKKEIYYIKLYNSTNHDIGYNIHAGGNGGDNLTNHPDRQLIIEKVRLLSMGRKCSEETKKKLSESQKGRILPESQKNHISESMIRNGSSRGENNWLHKKGYLIEGKK